MVPTFLRSLPPLHISILAGISSFCITVFPPSFPFLSFVLSFFNVVPLYLIGFLYGKHFVIMASAITIGMMLLFFNSTAALIQLVTAIIPLLIVTFFFNQKQQDLPEKTPIHKPLGHIVSYLVIYGLILLIFSYFFFIFQEEDPLIFFTKKISLLTQSTLAFSSSFMFMIIPSITFISLLFSTFLSTSISIKLLKLNNVYFPPFSKEDAQIHSGWDIVLCGGILLQFWSSPLRAFMGMNIALLASIPLFIFGLRVVYDIFQANNLKTGVFNIFLFICFFLLVWMGPVVVLIGLLEPLLKIRKRLS